MKSKEEIRESIEQYRREAHDYIDRECDRLLYQLGYDQQDVVSRQTHEERTFPIFTHPYIFKGKKPLAIKFRDGRVEEVSTWKQVYMAMLKECVSDPIMYQRLLELRDRISGNRRTIVSGSPSGMDKPLQIADGVYVESKYDTETLMQVLVTRIFDAIGYDYLNTEITIRDPIRTHTPQEEYTAEQNEASDEPTMSEQEQS